MLNLIRILVFLLSTSFAISSNICNFSATDSIYFGTINIRDVVNDKIVLRNSGIQPIILESIQINSQYQDYISVNAPNLPINISGSEILELPISITGKQNVDVTGIIFFRIKCNSSELSVKTSVFAKFSLMGVNPAASSTDNKWGAQLIDAISTYSANHNVFSYRDARKLFWGSFDKHDGVVECIYTGKTINPGNDPDFADLDSKGFNTEHSWPRSVGADNEPPLSDINHLFVTDKTTNDKRANYPFGFVKSGITYENGGSRLGRNAEGDIAFEVRDQYKGNIARAMFYFAVRYNNPTKFIDKQENDLRSWAKSDPVDDKETARNDSVKLYQGKSNLFIEFPELLDRIPNIAGRTNPQYIPNYFISDTNLVIDLREADVAQNKKVFIWVTNYSNLNNGSEKNFELNSIEFDGDSDAFTVEYDKSQIVTYNGYKLISIEPNVYNSSSSMNIKLSYKDGVEQNINVKTTNPILSVADNGYEELSITNYPNPAYGSTRIKIHGINSINEIKSIQVYDLNYGLTANLSSGIIYSDNSAIVDFKPQSISYSSGMYFVKVDLKGKSIIHPIIFLN